jgi:hypothetical protein
VRSFTKLDGEERKAIVAIVMLLLSYVTGMSMLAIQNKEYNYTTHPHTHIEELHAR